MPCCTLAREHNKTIRKVVIHCDRTHRTSAGFKVSTTVDAATATASRVDASPDDRVPPARAQRLRESSRRVQSLDEVQVTFRPVDLVRLCKPVVVVLRVLASTQAAEPRRASEALAQASDGASAGGHSPERRR